MEYFHHIGASRSGDSKLYDLLVENSYPIKIVPSWDGNDFLYSVFAFQMSESNPLWPQVQQTITAYSLNVVDRVNTVFSEEELRKAKWAWIGGTIEQLDAMPKYTWRWEGNTFEALCEKCWIYKQINPFRIRKEPRWGKNKILRLIALGEIFTQPEVVSDFKQQGFTGFEDGDVLIHKTGLPAETIRQLHFKEFCPVPVYNKADLVEVICPVCGRVRYRPHMRGTFQYRASDLEPVKSDFLQMQEWIGNGRISWHETLVSNRVVQYILDQKWPGIQLKAIDLVQD